MAYTITFRAILLMVLLLTQACSQNKENWFRYIKSGDITKIIELLPNVDLEIRDQVGRTGLHIASEEGYLDIAQLLIENGASVDSLDIHGNTPLNYATALNITNMIHLLVISGANVNIGNTNQTPLICSVRNNNCEAVSSLLEAGAMIDGGDGIHNALLVSVDKGLNDISMLLLESGAAIDGNINKFGYSPLHYAVVMRNIEMVQCLLQKGANCDLHEQTKRSPLLDSVLAGNIEIVDLLLSAGANPNVKEITGYYPISHAVRRDKQDVIEALLQAGADPTLKNDDGTTAMDQCIGVGNMKVLDTLVSCIGDDQKPAMLGRLLVNSICLGEYDIAEKLLHDGANVNYVRKDGLTPISACIDKEKMIFFELLRKYGVLSVQ